MQVVLVSRRVFASECLMVSWFSFDCFEVNVIMTEVDVTTDIVAEVIASAKQNKGMKTCICPVGNTKSRPIFPSGGQVHL